jgi:hypothetical protein
VAITKSRSDWFLSLACALRVFCSAARGKGHGRKMTRTKSRRRFPSDGCPGPLGDPLVCARFLDDGMIRVQLNQASSQRIESAAVPLLPLPVLHGERVGVRGIPRAVRAPPPASTNPISMKCTAESLPYRPNRAPQHKPSPDDASPSSESRIFQPTSSREAALGRSTGGKPGHRGGWKER